MEQHLEANASPAGKSRADTLLTAFAAVLAVAVVASAAFLAYSVWNAGNLERAANPTSRAIDILYGEMNADPGDVVLRVRLGEALAAAGRFNEAVRELEAALELDPEHTGAYLVLGIVGMHQAQWAGAEQHFLKVVELTTGTQFQDASDRREKALFYLGEIALNQTRYEDAVGYFKEALRIRRDSSVSYLNLGVALKGMGETVGAIENLENALAFDPTLAPAHYELGQIYLDQGDKVNAAVHLSMAAQYAPDREEPAQALVSLGSADQWAATAESAQQAGDLDRALEAALIARALASDNVEYVKLHARVLEERGAEIDARQVYEEALEMAPEDSEANAALRRLGTQ